MNYHAHLTEHYRAVRKRPTAAPARLSPPPPKGVDLGVRYEQHVWDYLIAKRKRHETRRIDDAPRAIVLDVAHKHNLEIDTIFGTCRLKFVTDARHELCFRLKTELGWTLPRIAKFTGRDHTTVLNSIRRYEQAINEGNANV